MRVLQINNVYGRLSTGKIVADLHHAYTELGLESYVCYARGPIVHEEGVIKFSWDTYAKANKLRGRLTGILYGGCYWATLRLITRIKNMQPDVVHLQCINDDSVNIYLLLDYLKKHQIPTVVTLHAEFLHTGTCGHAYQCNKWKTGCFDCEQHQSMHMLLDNTKHAWEKMQQAFAGFNENRIMITSVSPWLESRAAESAILGQYQHCTVMNGMDTEIFYRRDTASLRRHLGIGEDRKIGLFVTSDLDSPAKGGEYLIQLAEQMPDYTFIVLGTPGNKENIPANILRLGRIYDQDVVAQYYSMADLTLILSKAETFSMPVAESLCCGTPVAGFKAGGPESISMGEYSFFVEHGCVDELKTAMARIIEADLDREMISKAARKRYSKEEMARLFVQIYQLLNH